MTDPTPEMLARIGEILQHSFPDPNPFSLTATAATERLPLVKANVRKQTRSFSQGQKVHIYSVYWGLNERALVVARFRRKHDYIFGVIPIDNLENFRPEYVYHPQVLAKFRLTGNRVDSGIFSRFFNLPHQSTAEEYRYFLFTGRRMVRLYQAADDPTSDDALTAPSSWLARLLRGLKQL